MLLVISEALKASSKRFLAVVDPSSLGPLLVHTVAPAPTSRSEQKLTARDNAVASPTCMHAAFAALVALQRKLTSTRTRAATKRSDSKTSAASAKDAALTLALSAEHVWPSVFVRAADFGNPVVQAEAIKLLAVLLQHAGSQLLSGSASGGAPPLPSPLERLGWLQMGRCLSRVASSGSD